VVTQPRPASCWHPQLNNRPAGARKLSVIKTGDRTYCIIGEWDSMASIVAARPQMIGELDKIRGLLEDLGGGLGVTDPAAGPVVLALK